MVSHDRAFLDATVTSVVEIDEHDHRARLFGGGWSAYLEERVDGAAGTPRRPSPSTRPNVGS